MLCGLLSLILVGDVYSQFKLREVDVEFNVQTIVSVNVDPLDQITGHHFLVAMSLLSNSSDHFMMCW